MDRIFPTHLNEFLQCRHIITLKKQGVKGDAAVSEELELLQNLGHQHEKDFLDSLKGEIICIDQDAPPAEQMRQTVDAMPEGADYMYQGYVEYGQRAGYSDFLEKVPQISARGDYSYEVIDTKLARRATAGNAVHITSSVLRLASFTTTERNALAAQNGDMIYNTTDNKFQGYENGAWANLI